MKELQEILDRANKANEFLEDLRDALETQNLSEVGQYSNDIDNAIDTRADIVRMGALIERWNSWLDSVCQCGPRVLKDHERCGPCLMRIEGAKILRGEK